MWHHYIHFRRQVSIRDVVSLVCLEMSNSTFEYTRQKTICSLKRVLLTLEQEQKRCKRTPLAPTAAQHCVLGSPEALAKTITKPKELTNLELVHILYQTHVAAKGDGRCTSPGHGRATL